MSEDARNGEDNRFATIFAELSSVSLYRGVEIYPSDLDAME